MKRITPFVLTLSLLIAPRVVQADAWDKKTTVNFSQPVEVPGYVLQPGKYVMKLVSLPADRHVVQFSNQRENRVYASVMAISSYRSQVTDKTLFTFYEVPAGQPEAIKTWYYPGDNFGQEFIYPKGHFSETTAVTPPNQFIPAPQALADPPPPIEATADAPPESAAPVEIAQAAPPAPPQAEEALQNSPTPTSAELPETASRISEIALLGFLFVGGAVMARSLRRS